MSKETFKTFVRNHPELATPVLSEKTNWQKLYELYDLYGEDNPVWEKYFTTNQKIETSEVAPAEAPTGFKDIFNTFKNLDMDSVQKGVTNLQKTIGILQEIGLGAGTKQATKSTYEARPMYKYFED